MKLESTGEHVKFLKKKKKARGREYHKSSCHIADMIAIVITQKSGSKARKWAHPLSLK